MGIRGVNKVIKAMRKYRQKMERNTERAILKAALLLQALSQKIVPVDTGALKNSARTWKEGSGFKTKAHVQYSTNYAIYVHEDLEANHAPGKFAQFLIIPITQQAYQFRQVIRKELQRR